MAGNVWEWCLTKWRESYKTPPDDSPKGDALRVLRGGAYDSEAGGVRGGCRGWIHPNVRIVGRGFRLAQ